MPNRALKQLEQAIVGCRACPRLVAWREKVAREKVARHRACEYWGRPVPGFGDERARIVLVGLAPGAHGANRTGRVFTGDRSGDFLYAALHRAGLASQAASVARDDGLVLTDAYIVGALRCAPPGNAPAPDEIARCAPFLERELAALDSARVVVALGAIAWRATLDGLTSATRMSLVSPVPRLRPRPAFSHGARVALPGAPVLLGSYHVSQQNTQTGKLTPAMFDEVLRHAVECASQGAAGDAPLRARSCANRARISPPGAPKAR